VRGTLKVIVFAAGLELNGGCDQAGNANCIVDSRIKVHDCGFVSDELALVFYSPSCPECRRMKEEIMPLLELKVSCIEWINVNTEPGIRRFVEVTEARGIDPSSMAPLIIYRDRNLQTLEDMRTVLLME